MSKLIINIKSLTINLGAGVSSIGNAFHPLLAMILSRAVQEDQVTGSGETGTESAATGETNVDTEAAAASTEATAVTVELSYDNVLTFLNSDPRFNKRTLGAIFKHFADSTTNAVEEMLDEMAREGLVKRTVRRRDHNYLFESLVPVSPAPTEEPAATENAEAEAASTKPELTETNVRSFLGSDSRYTKRTFDAIAKHFGIVADDHAGRSALNELLVDMDDDGDIETKTRRADGATLYQLA